MTASQQEICQQLRAAARTIFDAALAAAEPGLLTSRMLAVEGRTVLLDGQPFPLAEHGRVILLAAGKAAAPMSRAATDILRPLAVDGLAVVRDLFGAPGGQLPLVAAGHPVPDALSCMAAQRMLDLARSAGPGDLVLCLFSGGASSLLCAPAPSLDLDMIRRTTGLLLRSGADIRAINCVRKHLSSIKGGLLAQSAKPAGLATLLLSDVVGDHSEVIASGPTVPDPTTFAEALEVLETHRLLETVPQPVVQRLRDGEAGALPETPSPGDPCFLNSVTGLVGSNADARNGASVEAGRLGFLVAHRTEPVTGEAREAGALIGGLTGRGTDAPFCHLSGGETTVTLPPHHGRGGRNMELALAAVPLLAEHPCSVLLSAGTDGSDGSSHAAGAFADSRTLERARLAGIDHRAALDRHDSFTFFQTLGDLVVTGPTWTNVMDLQLLLVHPA